MSLLNSILVRSLPYFPQSLVGLVAKRYIAGDHLQDAVDKTLAINQMGALATIDILGEFVRSEEEVRATVEAYRNTMDAIYFHKLQASISLKPTSLGYLIDKKLCYDSIRSVVQKAQEMKTSVTIDMEDHPLTDFTLQLYRDLREEFPQEVSTVLQAYMKRTLRDANDLCDTGHANIRLCKGIYVEPEEFAYQKTQEIHESYLATLDTLFSHKAYVGIATHNNALISGALALIQKHHLEPHEYEFQMLLGVRPHLLQKIIQKGHRIRVYVPYGKDWYAYSIRRLKENPSIAGNVVKEFLPRFMTADTLPCGLEG